MRSCAKHISNEAEIFYSKLLKYMRNISSSGTPHGKSRATKSAPLEQKIHFSIFEKSIFDFLQTVQPN